MTMRMGSAVMALAAIAVALIGIRHATLGAAAEIETLRGRQIELRRETWTLRTRLAAQRTPQEIQRRVLDWRLNVFAPPLGSWSEEQTLLADSRQ